jgi:putative copper export protein
MKDFQLSFASILKYISIVLIVIGVISIPIAIFLGFGHIFSTAFSEIFLGMLFYALSIIVQAAAIYIKKNTPEPQKPQEAQEVQENQE